MHRFFRFTAACALAASSFAAHAGLIDARFNGTVFTQQNSTFAVGSALAGEFVYDTAIGRYVSFVIGGLSVAPGFRSTAAITPDLSTAIYQAQVSPLDGGSTNSTFNLTLGAITTFPSANAIALLLNAAQLTTNLDLDFSEFGFFTANADGTNQRSATASLGAIRITAVPEPESIALLVIGAAALGLRRVGRTGR